MKLIPLFPFHTTHLFSYSVDIMQQRDLIDNANDMLLHTLCLKGESHGRQRKPPSYSQGQNSSAMDTTRKGLHTGWFIQVGGNASFRKIIRKSQLHF